MREEKQLRTVFWLMIVGILFLLVLVSLSSWASERPFWTEQSSFRHGELLYVVGIASHASSLERGRQWAFEQAKAEIRNYLHIVDFAGVTLDSQMTYEERHADGTVTVYRLVTVNLTHLQPLRRAERPSVSDWKPTSPVSVQRCQDRQAWMTAHQAFWGTTKQETAMAYMRSCD